MEYKVKIYFHNKVWEKEFKRLIALFFSDKKMLNIAQFKFGGRISNLKREKITLNIIRFFGVFEDAIKQSLINFVKENTSDQKLVDYLTEKIDNEPIGFSSIKSLKTFAKKIVGAIQVESHNGMDAKRINHELHDYFARNVKKMYDCRNDFAHKSFSTVSITEIPSDQEVVESFFTLLYVYSLISKTAKNVEVKEWKIDTSANFDVFVKNGFFISEQ